MATVLRTIKFDLSQEGIQKAIDQVRKFRNDLQKAMNDLIKWLSETGKEVAQLEVYDLGAYDTGLLYESIDCTFFPKEGIGIVFVGNNASHAIYVEYGVGYIEDDSKHPEADVIGYHYDTKHHGEEGWDWYNKRTGKFGHMIGFPSRPYMYLTMRELERIAEESGSKTLIMKIKGGTNG